MFKQILFVTTSLFLVAGFAEKKATKKATKETLTIDVAASTIGWVGSKKLGDKHNGQIKLKEGKVEMKGEKLVGGSFSIDMASITNEDLKEKPEFMNKLVGHLKSEDFFHVEKYPTADFKITSVKEKEGKPWVVGKLTMIGKTEKVEFPATLETKDGVTTGVAKIEIDRTKWNLKYGSGNIFKELTADKIINDKIELDLNLTAKK